MNSKFQAKYSNLHKACQNGNESSVRSLIFTEPGEVNQVKFGKTPLHLACIQGSLNIVKILVESGADIHAETKMKETPAWFAIEYGHPRIVTYLKDKGADLNKETLKWGFRPLTAAVINGHVSTLETLLSLGCDPNKTDITQYYPLHRAVLKNKISSAQILLKYNAFINQTCGTISKDTPLSLAVLSRNADMVQFLVDHGADVNLGNTSSTPLVSAVKLKQLDLIQCLVEGGADVNMKARVGHPVVHAIEQPDALLYLIHHGKVKL